MKIFFCLALTISFSRLSFSQSCNCKDNLNFVIAKVRENYAGFRDKVTPSNKAAYEALTDSLLTAAAKDPQDLPGCEAIINKYIAFFRDGHMYTSREQTAAPIDKDSVRRLYAHWPRVNTTESSLRLLLHTSAHSRPLEGIWINESNDYRLGVLYSAGFYRAFIIKADSVYWMPGQVKFLLRENPAGHKMIYYRRTHEADSLNIIFSSPEKTKMDLGAYGSWYKINLASGEPYTKITPPASTVVTFTRLSKKTNLLTIKSFDSQLIHLIDSIVSANDPLISTTENLILDLRGNGGGADAGFRPLKKYLYTNPYNVIGVDLYCSDDNTGNFRQYSSDKNFPEEDRKELGRYADSMTLHKGGYWSPYHTYDEEKMDSVLPFPKRIVVLMDNHCGSTTEQFLLDPAKNSKKTILMGTHSAGILDYANMNFLNMPCSGYQLGYATSRSKRIELGKGIDNTGILPDLVLDDTVKDWVSYAQQYMEK